MKAWDALIGRLTEPLGVDPELRMDVATELRCHLEDSAAGFRRAGQSADEAAASAAKALGDPDELTRQLWQANRRRLRIRGLLRWAARAALVPAAAAVILGLIVTLIGRTRGYVSPTPPLLSLAHPTPEQRFILHGDPKAADPVAAAKSISDRWPENPVYYANYVIELMNRGGFFDLAERIKPHRLEELVAVLDRGERIDPDNAFYNFMKAGVLAQASSTLEEDTSRPYPQSSAAGSGCRTYWYRIAIRDQRLFDRALAELRRGLGKKTATCRMMEMVQARLAQLPKPRGVSDMMSRAMVQAGTLMPPLSPELGLSRRLSARAIQLAEAGKADQAEELIDDALRFGGMIGGHGEIVLDVVAGEGIVKHALAASREVHLRLGRAEQAHAAGKALEEEEAWFGQIIKLGTSPLDQINRSAGLYWSVLSPALRGLKKDFEPVRSAEKAFAAELVLLGLLLALTGAAGFFGLWTLVSLAIRRGEDRPVLLFVGWERIGRICLLGLVAPLGAYFLYSWVLTGRDGRFGLNYTAGRTVLEYTVLVLAVFVLMKRLSFSAIAARAAEIGMAVPPPVRLRDRRILLAIGVALAAAVAVYLAGWWVGPFRPDPAGDRAYRSIPGFVLAGLVVAYAVAAGVVGIVSRIRRGRFGRFRRSVRRSAVPILAAAVIVLGIACGAPLARQERSAVARAKGPASFDLLTREVQDSDFRLLRQRLAARAEATDPAAK